MLIFGVHNKALYTLPGVPNGIHSAGCMLRMFPRRSDNLIEENTDEVHDQLVRTFARFTCGI